jgi:hypothetical protein
MQNNQMARKINVFAYFPYFELKYPSYSRCVYMCISLSLLGNGSVKVPLSVLGNDSVETLLR